LQFWGDQDPITPLSDAQRFVSEYGGNACLSVLAGGGHAPYYEPVKETFWNQSFAFLDGDGDCWDHSGGDPCGDEVDGASAASAVATSDGSGARELTASESSAVASEAEPARTVYAF